MGASKEIQALLEVAKPGDMIQFDRSIYSHWGIYIGDNMVIHLWGDNDGIGYSISLRESTITIFGENFNRAKIMKSEISIVLKHGGKVRVNNYLDSKKKPLPVKDILERANRALGREGYNVISNNCEHFATDCRYGQSVSHQVQKLVIASVIAGICVIGIVVGAAVFAVLSSHNKDDDDE